MESFEHKAIVIGEKFSQIKNPTPISNHLNKLA
jgi:hypothetical protein